MQYSSGTRWTLSVLVVLISTSTTAQLLGGSFVLFLSDTAALLCSSLVSATVSLSMVSTKELCFVQCTPAACCFAKSTTWMEISSLLIPAELGHGTSTSGWICFSILYMSLMCYSLYDVVIVRARSSRTEGSWWLVVVLLIVFSFSLCLVSRCV